MLAAEGAGPLGLVADGGARRQRFAETDRQAERVEAAAADGGMPAHDEIRRVRGRRQAGIPGAREVRGPQFPIALLHDPQGLRQRDGEEAGISQLGEAIAGRPGERRWHNRY